MKFTLGWLKDHLDTDAGLEAILAALTDCGLEVEGVDDPAAKFAAFSAAQVIAAAPHPNADRLRLCRVMTGEGEVAVVCGAPNARAGMKAVFAPEGSYIPGTGVTLKATMIRGVASHGMLCSERELELSDEHEGIIELPAEAAIGAPLAQVLGLDDPVIDVAITPNRQDCMGVRGIARDLAAKGLGKLKPLSIPEIAGAFASPIGIALDFPEEARDACPVFAGRLIRGVTNGPSPDWLQRRLRAIGLRPISALVDITNYFTIDLARPLHVYDAAKLKGDIRARLGRAGESLLALDGKTYGVDEDICVIADDQAVRGLGGVMGGEDSSVGEDTVDVFLECAYFDPVRTARTGRRLGIESDARARFERGVDPAFVRDGEKLASAMIMALCGGKSSQAIIAGAEPVTARAVRLRPARVESLAGFAIAKGQAADILRRLGFAVSDQGAALEAVVPSWRRDIEGEADLVEEIARIHGYDHIPTTSLPRPLGVAKPSLSVMQKRSRKVRRFLAARGLNEAVTWSFIAPSDAAAFAGAKAPLRLANPISADMAVMRPSLLPGLARAAARNLDRGQTSVRLFELGVQYHDASPEGQAPVAALVLAGLTGPRHWRVPARPFDLFDAKAEALAALASAGVPIDKVQVTADAPAWYHPGRSGVIRLGPKTTLAEFGMLHPGLARHFGLKAEMAMAELYLAALPAAKATARGRPPLALSDLPAVERDFAFVVAEEVTAEAILRAARGADKAHIADARLFDVYSGPGIAAGHKSVAIALTLAPRAATFTDAEIEAIRQRVIARVGAATGARLRA
ncbi:MAG: phenylalanine--tRNA ligase subunit beta [Pseudomonadota bacterium]